MPPARILLLTGRPGVDEIGKTECCSDRFVEVVEVQRENRHGLVERVVGWMRPRL